MAVGHGHGTRRPAAVFDPSPVDTVAPDGLHLSGYSTEEVVPWTFRRSASATAEPSGRVDLAV